MRTALVLLISGLAAAQSAQQFADIGDFRLENGQTIPHCRIGYRTPSQMLLRVNPFRDFINARRSFSYFGDKRGVRTCGRS